MSGGIKSFSIKRTAAETTKQQDVATNVQAMPTFEDQPVDATNLIVAWREFAKNLPQEDRAMSFQMNNMTLMLQEDGTTFLVIADNPSLQQELLKMQPRIEAYLHQRLQNNALKMTTRLREVTDKRRVFSRKEIYQQMLKQNEALRKLKEEFQLELV